MATLQQAKRLANDVLADSTDPHLRVLARAIVYLCQSSENMRGELLGMEAIARGVEERLNRLRGPED